MSDVIIRADAVGKRYLIGHQAADRESYTALRDVIGGSLKRVGRSALDMMRGKQIVVGDEVEDFWALKGISFEIKRGEVVGIIGRNGAGKSTLLKILSRITEPSAGRVEIKGRVASLLEVGTGFHPELTGRENIYLNGTILGMSRAEIRAKFDEIVAFAEIARFLDTPVKRYSSGMYVRLAFAVAAHLEPEILIVDEVLAVGDAEFQKKCLGKMGEVSNAGRTVLFVSHNLSAVRNLCTVGMLLDGGHLKVVGDATHAIASYERCFKAAMRSSGATVGPLAETVKLDFVSIRQGGVPAQILDSHQPFEIDVQASSACALGDAELKLSFFRDGVHLTSCFDVLGGAPLASGSFTSSFKFAEGTFKPGGYTIGIGVCTSKGAWLWSADVALVEFSENVDRRTLDRTKGLVDIPYEARRSSFAVRELNRNATHGSAV